LTDNWIVRSRKILYSIMQAKGATYHMENMVIFTKFRFSFHFMFIFVYPI